MSDKLLREFIEASGYEVKTTPKIMTDERRKFLESENMHLTILTEGAECDYKLTKKDDEALTLLKEVIEDKDEFDWCLGADLLDRIEKLINEQS